MLRKQQSLVIAIVLSIGIAGIGLAWMQDDIAQTQNLPYLGHTRNHLLLQKCKLFQSGKNVRCAIPKR